jgi:peptide/nickel transport system ATP-binding protein
LSLVCDVRDAVVRFEVPGGHVRALDGVSLSVAAGETVAVVGESGCGKTTLARVLLGLQRLSAGQAYLTGHRVEGVARGQAARVGIVWQDPFASQDPRWSVGQILEEPFRLAGASGDVPALMAQVGLDPALRDRYPHQLSGGQRQRVAIARALALRPPLVICDEPTAALDLSVQAQILNLLKDLQAETGSAFLYISHDLGTVRYLADRVAVMYMGRIVETGPAESVFRAPMHPYTAALLASAPSLESLGALPAAVPGEVPDPRTIGAGCRYAGRCPRATDQCRSAEPPAQIRAEQTAACVYPLEGAAAGPVG